MTVTYQLKISDNKIKENQTQHDLDRLAAKISALSSGELRKYEYLTGENLGYELCVLEQKKFNYSPLGKIFNIRLDKDDQKEDLFKRLENTENKFFFDPNQFKILGKKKESKSNLESGLVSTEEDTERAAKTIMD